MSCIQVVARGPALSPLGAGNRDGAATPAHGTAQPQRRHGRAGGSLLDAILMRAARILSVA
jgi:hypothetical protein